MKSLQLRCDCDRIRRYESGMVVSAHNDALIGPLNAAVFPLTELSVFFCLSCRQFRTRLVLLVF
jgi:hypothetical protein